MVFKAPISKIGHNDQLLGKPNSDLRDVSEPNGTAHGDVRTEITCCHKLFAQNCQF